MPQSAVFLQEALEDRGAESGSEAVTPALGCETPLHPLQPAELSVWLGDVWEMEAESQQRWWDQGIHNR